MSIWHSIKETLNTAEKRVVELLDKMKPTPERTWDKNLPYTPEDEAADLMLRSTLIDYAQAEDYMYVAYPAQGIYKEHTIVEGDRLSFNILDTAAGTLDVMDYWVSHQVPLMVYSKPDGETIFMEENDNKSWVALPTTL